MDISFHMKDRSLVAKIVGDIDHHSAADIRDRLDREFSRARAKNIIFDFSEVSFMDSSGIGMVIGRYKAVEKLGGSVAITSLRGDVSRLFNISGLQKIIRCFDTNEEALQNLA